MRFLLFILSAVLTTTVPGFAQSPGTACYIYGPSYQLASDTVQWSMTIGSGQSCIRGLRSAVATIDNIELVAPPQFGQVIVEGPGFVYRAGADFPGEDSFAISVSGKLNRISGSSTIQVKVLAR